MPLSSISFEKLWVTNLEILLFDFHCDYSVQNKLDSSKIRSFDFIVSDQKIRKLPMNIKIVFSLILGIMVLGERIKFINDSKR